MNSQWKIRLLGGVLNGREIILHQGTLSIGEQQCDLLLPLQGHSHLTLTVEAEQLFINTGGAPLRVNGRCASPQQALPAGSVIETAGIVMAVGPVNMNLATCTLPTRSRHSLILPGALLLVLLPLLALLSSSLTAVSQVPSASQQLVSLLSRYQLDKLQTSWLRDGSVTLSGYCDQQAQLDKLLWQLNAKGIIYRNLAICNDQIARNVSEILSQGGYQNVQVITENPGSVIINADITNGKQWQKVQDNLRNVEGLRQWRIENQQEITSNAIINTLLASGLADKLSLTPTGKTFVISGIVDSNEQPHLKKILAQLKTEFPTQSIDYQAIATPSNENQLLPSPIEGVITGQRGTYLMLKNGERLQVGSRLADGTTLISLTPNAFSLRHHGALITIPLRF